MKKLVSALLAALLVLCAAACERKPAAPTPTDILRKWESGYEYIFIERRGSDGYAWDGGDSQRMREGFIETLNSTQNLSFADAERDGFRKWEAELSEEEWEYKVTCVLYEGIISDGKRTIREKGKKYVFCLSKEIEGYRYARFAYDDGSIITDRSKYLGALVTLLEDILTQSAAERRIREYTDGEIETDMNIVAMEWAESR